MFSHFSGFFHIFCFFSDNSIHLAFNFLLFFNCLPTLPAFTALSTALFSWSAWSLKLFINCNASFPDPSGAWSSMQQYVCVRSFVTYLNVNENKTTEQKLEHKLESGHTPSFENQPLHLISPISFNY